MNKNEESLISHALKLYGMQYNDNIYSNNYNTKKYIEVGDRNIQDSYILYVYNGISYMSLHKSHNTSLSLNINIRSFINHWIQYYNVNEKINCVAVRKCARNTLDISILCNDNCWYDVLISPYYSPFDSWISYNW